MGRTDTKSLSPANGPRSDDDELVAMLGTRLVGRSPEMRKLCRMIATLSRSPHPVLIEGESGTGKELVARAIHLSGPCWDKPFIAVDCGSIVPTLIETELFGHVQGAFTGAVGSKNGLLVLADSGTVFLDEVGELPIDLQPKLLRALQEKEVRPVGGTRPVHINARILAATNRDLEAAVQQGTFRKDLYFRLKVVHLQVPPLRERRQDIPVLVSHFIRKLPPGADGVTRTITAAALELMLSYNWPGNVRELQHCLEHASVLAFGPVLQVADLPLAVSLSQTTRSVSSRGGEIIPIAELEKRAILSAISAANGDKREAARLLGISKTTLYRKLREWGSHH
ncbi:MAG: sigma-54 interaction domain-containing protein [Terriglobales bacterium]